MKRKAAMGMCVIASIASIASMTAIATGASAAVPTWYECVKTAMLKQDYTGKYNDHMCSSANAEGKGAYELREGVKSDRRIRSKRSPLVLRAKSWFGEVTIDCALAKSTGVAKDPNFESAVEMRWKGCSLVGGKQCSSTGARTGEIRLRALTGELGYLEESPVVVGLRLELESSPGGAMVSFSCGTALEATLSGAMIGVQAEDVNVLGRAVETAFTTAERLGEVEQDGHTFAPVVNQPGWQDELAAIAAGETPAHVLKLTMCGEYVESLSGAPCASEVDAGVEQTLVQSGPTLMIKA